MPATRTNDSALIVAAQAGDRRALDELVLAHLPLVYTIVRRALSCHPDVDDVVQEVMLRALRQLPVLREPESFRPWLAAIAVNQISTHLHRENVAAERTTALDEIVGVPEADFEGVTLLRVELSAQRRQVVRASRWLDPDDRALLSLWWLETAGQLTRTELAATLRVSIAHAGVRVQRMRDQLDVSRSVVAALNARPGCRRLASLTASWNGVPSPLWRKRIVRHTRSCAVCASAADGMVATERLLVGLVLLPVPVALGGVLIGKSMFTAAAAGAASTAALSGAAASAGAASTAALSGAAASGSAGAGVKAGVLVQLIQVIVAHPVVASVAAGALVVGAAVTTTQLPAAAPPPPVAVAPTTSRPVVIAAPTPAPPARLPTPGPPRPPVVGPSAASAVKLALGPMSLESANYPGVFIATAATLGVMAPLRADSAVDARARATFEVVAGLADANCYSLRVGTAYLRHLSWRLQLSEVEETELFRGDATFCVRVGPVAGSVSLEASNYPGWILRHRDGELWVDLAEDTAAFRADSSFLVRPPLR